MTSSAKYTARYDKDFGAEPKERKHFILLDGTWNDETGLNADGLVTNIVNLKRILTNNHDHQIVRYHRGVGNDNDNGWVKSIWKGATGTAIASIVERAYARFVQDWQKGDLIYIFGFSRGAAAARILASKIAKLGVAKSVEITVEPKENKETKVVEQAITDVRFPSKEKMDVDIEFLGVWDTVSALGLKTNVRRFIGKKDDDLFTDDHIAKNIKRAVHLVAIDETRNIFVPSLMNHKQGIVHEVWFPGVHSDIGGSYKEDEIAKASLFYMFKKLRQWNEKHGRKDFIINDEAFKTYAIEKIDRASFHFHGLDAGKDIRSIGVQVNGNSDGSKAPKIHQLYYDIASSGNSYSIFEEKKVVKEARFQYMPFNVKVLESNFRIVS